MARVEPIQVEGLAALIKAMRQAELELDDLKTANQSAARIVADDARGRAPQRTGALAASGRANRAAKKANVIFGSARVPYAGPIHWGWESRHIKAQPFITEAVKATQDEWLAAYERDLNRIIDDIERAT
jgi:HK97 gp10 family phage protein